MKKKYWLLLILGIIAIVSAVIYFKNKKEDKIDDTNAIKARVRTIEDKQLISGRLSSSKEVNIKPELAGIISELYVNIGDEVKKGQAIAKIKTLPDPKSTQDADRQVNIAHTNLERIKSNFNRNKSLYDQGIISKQEYEISNQEIHVAQEEYSSAVKYKKIVKQGFANSSDFVSNVVYSTIDGIILELPVKVGASVVNRNTFNEGTTVAIISDMNEILFKGQINEKDLINLKLDMIMKIKVNAIKDKTFEAKLNKISPKGIDVGGITRFDIEAIMMVNSVDLYKFKSGFTATAEITIDKREKVLSIEEKYIQYAQDTTYVNVIDGDKTKRNIVKLGISDGQFVEIKSGLSAKDKISQENEIKMP